MRISSKVTSSGSPAKKNSTSSAETLHYTKSDEADYGNNGETDTKEIVKSASNISKRSARIPICQWHPQ